VSILLIIYALDMRVCAPLMCYELPNVSSDANFRYIYFQ